MCNEVWLKIEQTQANFYWFFSVMLPSVRRIAFYFRNFIRMWPLEVTVINILICHLIWLLCYLYSTVCSAWAWTTLMHWIACSRLSWAQAAEAQALLDWLPWEPLNIPRQIPEMVIKRNFAYFTDHSPLQEYWLEVKEGLSNTMRNLKKRLVHICITSL